MDPLTAATPSGGLDFGNADQPQAPPPPPPAASTMPMAGDGAEEDCEEGVFCAPSGPDQGCGKITFEAETEVTRNPGNLLLVFDRSSSMLEQWEGQPRWQAAGSAIVAALEPLAADIAQAGVVFFPTPPGVDPQGPGAGGPAGLPGLGGPGCEVDGADPSQIGFTPGDQFIGAFNMPGVGTPAAGLMNLLGPPVVPTGEETPYYPVVGGFTPLMEGLQQAQNVLANATLEGVTAVVVITDGQPNCLWDPAMANQIVSDWLMNLGISTHVIGLPGIGGAAGLAGLFGQAGAMLDGTQVLNELAAAGGTGEFITPADPAALQAQLQSIISETVSMGFDNCNITLNPAAVVPDELLMIVEEPGVTDRKQVPRSFGWELNSAGDQVTMTGALCDEAMGGRFTSITFEYACPEAPPPEPIPPLM